MRFRCCLLPLLASSLLVGTKSDAGQTVDTNPVVGRAIDHLRNLEYGVAKQQLRAWLDSDPTDLYAWNYLAVATLYEEMLKRGVLESKVYGEGGDIFKGSNEVVTPTFEAELFSILDKSQQLAEARLKSNANDKDAMYWMGVGHGTRATYHFALRKQYISALREATTAYKYHEHLLKIDADFVDCYLIVGINSYVVGSLPWYVKAMASLAGRHGNREEGLRQVRIVTEKGRYAREDAKLMLAVLYERERMHDDALILYQEMSRSFPRNYLLQYEVASLLCSLKRWQQGAQAYDDLLAARNVNSSDNEHVSRAKVLYQAGQAYEHLEQYEPALARYSQAQELPGNNRYIYASGLAAANLYEHLRLIQEARVLYQRVADATPGTEEGDAARRALRRLERN